MPEINPKNGYGGRGPLLLRRHPRPEFEGLNKRMKDDTCTSFEELFARMD
jgi:hypothetical protein